MCRPRAGRAGRLRRTNARAGILTMTSITVPDYGIRGRRWWPVLAGTAGVVLVGVVGMNWYLKRAEVTAVAGNYVTVVPMDLAISIKKDGDLQAVSNIDITCEVEGQSRIQTIVKEGSMVKKGDVMIVLDSAEIARKLNDAKVLLQKCESDLTRAIEEKAIQEQKNTADLEGAEVERTLAELDLSEYNDGKYPQLLTESKTALKMAEIKLKNKLEEKEQTDALYLKGFEELARVKLAELNVLEAQNELDKKRSDLEVLAKYTYQKESTDRRNKLKQAERKLARTKKENASNSAQKEANVSAAVEAQKAQKYLVEHLEKQLAFCEIKAPSDGMVVYGSTGQQWYYRERPIQAGAQVNQQELLLRLPDTGKMKAVVKVPESWIGKLKVDEKNPVMATVEIVGVPRPVTARVTSVSVMADNSQRWFNPDARDYPVELTLDETPPGLKPGASAKAEINIEKLTQVMAVPMNAIYAVGQDKYVFVKDLLRGVRPEKVTLGQSNDTHVEVKGGLASGQDVLLLQVGQGRELLEKAGIKAVAPTTQPGAAPQPPPGATGAPVAMAR
jgi:RND family efflux transporter MFP subunit